MFQGSVDPFDDAGNAEVNAGVVSADFRENSGYTLRLEKRLSLGGGGCSLTEPQLALACELHPVCWMLHYSTLPNILSGLT